LPTYSSPTIAVKVVVMILFNIKEHKMAKEITYGLYIRPATNS